MGPPPNGSSQRAAGGWLALKGSPFRPGGGLPASVDASFADAWF